VQAAAAATHSPTTAITSPTCIGPSEGEATQRVQVRLQYTTVREGQPAPSFLVGPAGAVQRVRAPSITASVVYYTARHATTITTTQGTVTTMVYASWYIWSMSSSSVSRGAYPPSPTRPECRRPTRAGSPLAR
jgi:hypothetical protein